MLNNSQHTSGAASLFSFELLKQITDNFSKGRIIGRGAYGVVFKGVLDNGEEIAVKKLAYQSPEHGSKEQFENECSNLMKVQHQNIMRLVGYCHETRRHFPEYGGKHVWAEEDVRILCFEYLEGGSLGKYVLDEPCKLDWDICYKIIKGMCEGLNRLHRDSILHLDLKPENILLDNNMIPKIGDFALSRFFPSAETRTTTKNYGTLGYIPPEHIDRHQISPKYDVFSLGVIIIQIMAGRNGYNDLGDTTSFEFIEFVCQKWQKVVHATMWSHISQEVKTCIEIALSCVERDRRKRPTIRQIVDALNTLNTGKPSLACEATNLQSREALDYNHHMTSSASMGVHDGATRFESTDGVPSIPNNVEGDDRLMHCSMYQDTSDPMDYEQEPIMKNPSPSAIGGLANTAIWEPRDVTRSSKINVLDDGYSGRNSDMRFFFRQTNMPFEISCIRALPFSLLFDVLHYFG